jgi:hypothetical protein
LSISKPTDWAPGAEIEEPELESIRKQAEALSDKYWQEISQYLQHCTVRRHNEKKSWNLSEMFAELELVISCFRELVKKVIEIA